MAEQLKADSKTTPSMMQFFEIKERHPDALLFFRMGDFYEMFFEDAQNAAAALDIALTKRGKHQGEDIPMCGVPAHAATGYLQVLIRKGFRVAVCEQMESPAEAKKRGSKSVVRRDVVRLVTPGTITEDALLDSRSNNYLVSYVEIRGEGALACVDVSTGDFFATNLSRTALPAILARLSPTEALITDKNFGDIELMDIIEDSGAKPTALGAASFDSQSANDRLKKHFNLGALDAFGDFSRSEISALGAVLDYLVLTQKGQLPFLRPPRRESTETGMRIDAATRRNLELTEALSGGRSGSLLNVIDKTITGAGARLLSTRLSAPLTDPEIISQRHDSIGFLLNDENICSELIDSLKSAPDIERALSRLTAGRGGPRDLGALKNGLIASRDIRMLLDKPLRDNDVFPQELATAAKTLVGFDNLITSLSDRLSSELPMLARDGGFIRAGVDAALDEARALRDNSRRVIAEMEQRLKSDTGITSLKIKHTNIFGYFVEVPAAHADKLMTEPYDANFMHRQTLANAVRFTTVELSDLDTKITQAGGQALARELELFDEMISQVVHQCNDIATAAHALATIDVSAGLANLANRENWKRPIVDDSAHFKIEGGRHPVVEAALRKDNSNEFIPNDCDLSVTGEEARRLWLLTGPNMAGKSTFLRQNALIALLAQMGSYVPATAAHIGVVDQLFSRVGAADDLARGRSTFMVEMVETATIINQAGPRALVILDEIGRGTATYDGLSIAWAVLEHLHSINRCRGLFATHYHELTSLTTKLDGLKNATMKVREWEGDVVFLHEVTSGAADRSYGVQVAKLAGLPPTVIERAREVLEALESKNRDQSGTEALIDDLPLFTAPVSTIPVTQKGPSPLDIAMKDINPDDMSPREALDALYILRNLRDENL